MDRTVHCGSGREGFPQAQLELSEGGLVLHTDTHTYVYMHMYLLPSAQDAAWVNGGNTLQCSSPADVYLLLKSSDFIQHDLSRV